jgi:serine/threonine protein kinase/formylglycine-generating enzyme required for sulfatase activity
VSGYEWEASGEELLEDSSSVSPSVPPPEAGTSLAGRYDLLEVLGRGGMGIVYRARDREAERDVALKLLLESEQGAGLERFWREGQVTASLEHPGIVRIHSAGRAHGRPYLAYELVEGGRTLAEVFAERGLLERVALVRDAAEALGHAHTQGVVHRDVKPENVLVDSEGRVRVADFGLALVGGLERLTRTGALLGTPSYMAPEQIAPDKAHAVGPATDVWALGAMLYEALTGRLPFPAADLVTLAGQVLSGRVSAPRKHAPEVGSALEATCLRALSLEIQDRHADAGVFANALSLALEGRASGDEARASARGARRRWGLALALGAAALGAAALLKGGLARLPATSHSASPSASAGESPTGANSATKRTGPPAWFTALPAERRPPLPLPRGVSWGRAEGEYLNGLDDSILVWVPPGRYSIGARPTQGQPDEYPRHEVRLSGYFLGKFEVTWEQFTSFCQRTRREPPSRGLVDESATSRHPVFNVTHADALAYCVWANLRLPTEAEWEIGAAGAEGRLYPWGETEPGPGTPLFANDADMTLKDSGQYQEHYTEGYRDGFVGPAPVGSFPKGVSPWGAHDMAGNVWEWVADYMGRYSAEAQRNPTGPVRGLSRVARGGSSQEHFWGLRTVNRMSFVPDTRLGNLGFRVAR